MTKFRVRILFFVFGIICLIIIAKLYILSIERHNFYNKLSIDNTIKTEILIPIRGHILDRNNEPLAINELGFQVLIKTRLSEKKLRSELSMIKNHIIDIDEDELYEKYMKSNSIFMRSPIVLIDFLPYAQMQTIYSSLMQSSNITLSPTTKRFYPNNSSASHVIGYIGASDKNDAQNNIVSKYTKIIGKQGLEKQYNTFLQGELGYKKIQVNSLNQQLNVLDEKKATSNNYIKTSIDIRLQEVLDELFATHNGVGIIMDSTNGEILAAGSYPEYDINDFIDGISSEKYKNLLENPHKPLINKFINGQYPPGSVVKMGMALSFLEFAGINEKTVIDTPGFITIANRKFRDWKPNGHGKSDLIKSIRESVDVYFYKLSLITGISNMYNTMSTLGFGKKTEIDLPYENKGIFPTPEWKIKNKNEQWYIGDTIVTSIGQGFFLVTPMQIARYTALLASGKLVTPHFVKNLGDQELEFKTENVLSDFQKSKLPYLRTGMKEVCQSPLGTAYSHTKNSKVSIACKTGTAQVIGISQDVVKRDIEDDLDYFSRSQGWITAFLPVKNPKYVITILIEHSGSGSRAGPLLVRLVNELYKLGYVKKD